MIPRGSLIDLYDEFEEEGAQGAMQAIGPRNHLQRTMLQVAVEEQKFGDVNETPKAKKITEHGRDKDKPLNKQLGD